MAGQNNGTDQVFFHAAGEVPDGSRIPAYISYDAAAALDFAQDHCSQDCPCGERYGDGSQLSGDCTHFLSHILYAGGWRISGSWGRRCPWACITWAPDLKELLDRGVSQIDNLQKVPVSQARAGDFGFLENDHGMHAVFLASAISGQSAAVYSHSTDRCGKVVTDDRFPSGSFYRIT